MLTALSKKILIAPTVIALLAVMGTSVSALPALIEPDFDPFVLREDYWTAEIALFPDGRIVPGSSTYEIEYTSRKQWKVTQLTHSFQPERSGTRWTFDGVTLMHYDARRRTERASPYPDAVDNWIQPGQLAALSRRIGTTIRDDARTGQREISWSEASQSGAVGRTVVRFDRATRLPVLVEDWNGTSLVRRITFTRIR